jgi:hypothetical protein
MARRRSSKKTSVQLEEQKLRWKTIRLTSWIPVIQNLIRWAGVSVTLYFLFRSVEVLAGRTTDANFGLKVLASKYAGLALMALFGGGGVAYGLQQRKLRRDAVAHVSPRIEELERRLDRKRSSSKLTTRGETNPGDVL